MTWQWNLALLHAAGAASDGAYSVNTVMLQFYTVLRNALLSRY